ncbi:hypothetical protein CSB37_01610 [bacterium DOLZORAL124_38_8]|nr:MAG: hypothetical protein CSB37_01610 [bacterium DOLZORAL124_38_8]
MKTKHLKAIIVFFALIVILYLVNGYYNQIFTHFNNEKTAKIAQYGDTLGGIFGFISAIFALYTINQQIKEKKIDRFEQNLFHLMNLHHEIRKNIKYNNKAGVNAFQEFFKKLTKKDTINYLYEELEETITDKENYFNKELNKNFKKNQEILQDLNNKLKEIKDKFKRKKVIKMYYKKMKDVHTSFEIFSILGTYKKITNKILDKIQTEYRELHDKLYVLQNKNEYEKLLKILSYQFKITTESSDIKNFYKEIKPTHIKKEEETNENFNLFRFNEKYMRAYSNALGEFGHYFRNIYQILKLINEAEINKEQKETYFSQVIGQLSDYETICIFCNAISENGIKKVLPILQEYDLIRHAPSDEINNLDIHKNLI